MHRTLLAAAAAALLVTPVGASAQDDIGSSAEAICCGTNCCAIPVGDGCQTRGEVNPDNPCEVCDPSNSQSAFTVMPGCGTDGGTSTDAGSPAVDSGPTTVDAGTGSGDDGGCSVQPGAASSAGLVMGLLALGAFVLRRRLA